MRASNDSFKLLYTVKEAALLLGISEKTLAKAISINRIPLVGLADRRYIPVGWLARIADAEWPVTVEMNESADEQVLARK